MSVLDMVDLLNDAWAALRDSGLDVRPMAAGADADATADGVVQIGWGGHHETFDIRVKRSLRPAAAALAVQDITRGRRPLLVTDRISGGVARLARQSGLSYVDASGNAWISSPGFLVDIQGRSRSAAATAAPSVGRATFTKADLRAVLAIVVRHDAELPPPLTARELGAGAGVSHGAANLTLQKMRNLGFLSSGRLRRGAQLLDQWTEAYLARGGMHRTARTLHVAPDLPLADVLMAIPGVEVSGEFAGEQMGWPIRSTSALVYAPAFADVARRLRGSSEGPGRRVEVRTPGVASTTSVVPGVAASMLVRADMLMSMDPRQIEVAREVIDRDQNLRRLREVA